MSYSDLKLPNTDFHSLIEIFIKLLENAFFILFLIISLSLILFSMIHYYRVKRFLFKKLETVNTGVSSIKEKYASINPEMSKLDLVPVGVSVFDILYHMNKVDPLLVRAVDRLHHSQNFENFFDLSNYLKDLVKNTSDERLIHKYKGYFGEEDTFDKLSLSDGNLFIPTSGTNPGFDFIYNDQKYNRAVSSNSEYLDKKLNDLPDDINLWVSPDVDKKYEAIDKVFIHKNSLTEKECYNLTSDSINGITNLGSFIDTIPLLTLTVSAYKNINHISKGDKNLSTAAEHVVLDTVGVGVGGYLGSHFGVRLGQILSPVTGGASAIVIPVATTIIGTLIGVFTGKGIVKWFKERHYRKALRKLEDECITFANTYNKKVSKIFSNLELSHSNKSYDMRKIKNQNQNLFFRMFFPNVTTLFIRKALKRYKEEVFNLKKYYSGLYSMTKRKKDKDKKQAGLILFAQGTDILLDDENLISCHNNIERSLVIFDEEKNKLGLM